MKTTLKIILLIILFFNLGNVLAQDVKVHGGFIQDSLIVGDQVNFYLSAKYPKSKVIFFPDSTWQLGKFEFVKKQYFPTQTINGISTDSAVYTITSFEIDSIQTLRLPVYQINTFDSTFFYSETDSIFLTELVNTPLPDTLQAQNLPLKTNTTYQPVSWLLNYPFITFIVCLLFLSAVFLWVFFGKKITNRYTLKRLNRLHEEFVKRFIQLENELKLNFSSATAELLITHWKKYLENLDKKPYTRLTVKELSLIQSNETLIQHLRSFDAAVYGHRTEVQEDTHYLKEYAELTFQEKLKAFKNEK